MTWDAQAVRQLRRQMGMSQQEFARHLGVRQQTVSDWEIGKHHVQRHLERVLTMVGEQVGFQA